MSDPLEVEIAVALIKLPDRRIVLTWNDNWKAFAFPMTKVHTHRPDDSHEKGAIRAAAEALRVPTRLPPNASGSKSRAQQRSTRDDQIKEYKFTIIPVEPHPDFVSVAFARDSLLVADVNKLQLEEYQPLSPSVQTILVACIEKGLL